MVDDFLKELHKIIQAVKLEEDRIIEEAVEKALQGGEHGVLVIRDNNFRFISANPNPLVPYGTIYVMEEYNAGFGPPPEEGGRGA